MRTREKFFFLKRAVITVACLSLFFVRIPDAQAAVRTWDGGGGADTNWGTCANWSGDTCPTSADIATFDGTSTNNVTIATTLTGSTAPAGIDINAGYTGIITVNSGVSVSVGSTGYDQAAGTFTGSDGAMNVTGAFVLSAGTFTAPSGTLTLANNFTHTAGGTFTHNSGTVVLSSGTARTWDVATTEEFYNLTINSTYTLGAGMVVATGDTFNVNGTFTMTDGTFGTGTIAAKGAVSIGADAGYTSMASGTLLINGSGSQTITVAPNSGSNEVVDQFTVNNASATVNGTGANGTLRFDKITVQAGTMALTTYSLFASEAVTISGGTLSFTNTGTATFDGTFEISSGAFTAGSSTVDHNGTVTISGGTYTASSGTTTIEGAYTHTAGGTFTHNSGVVTLDGTTPFTWDVATSEEFYSLTINNSYSVGASMVVATGDTLNVNGTFTMTDGTFGTGTIAAKGAVSIEAGAGYSSSASGTLLINGSGSQTITVAPLTTSTYEIVDQFTVNNASATVNGTGANGTLRFDKITVQAGTMALTTYSLTASEAVTISGGTLSFTNTGTATFTNTFAISSGAFSGGSSTIDYNSDVTISGGTYTASSGTTTLNGDYAHTAGGTFTHNSGTWTWDGTGAQAIDVTTTETFGAMVVNKSSGSTATIATGDTLVATGALTLTDGKFTAGALEAQGDVSIATTYDASSTTTLTFTGSATQTLTTNNSSVYIADVFVNKSGGQVNMVGTWTLGGTNQDLTIQEGTFDLNGYALSVTGGGTEKIVVETGGNLQLQGGETITADSASYPQLDSGSTVTYDGTSGPYTMKDYTYHHLVINGGATSVFTQAANESYGGNVTITQGILSQGGFTTTVTGTFANSGTLRRLQIETFTGTMDVDSGTVEYAGDGDAQETVTITDFNVVGTDYYNLLINDANVTKDIFTLGTGLTVAGTLQVTSSEFTQGANAITAAALTVDGGTFTGGSAAVTVNGALTLSSGVLTATTNTTTVTGAFTHTAGGTFTHNSGTVAFTGSAATVDVATSETFSALTINKTDGQTLTITSGDTLTATGVLTLTNGAWGTGGLVAQGSIVVGSGWDAAGTATLTISGSGTQTLDLSAAAGALDNPVIINKAGGSFTFASAVTLDATGADWTLTNGTVSTGNFTLTTSTGSDIAVNGGTLSAGSSTMTIAGALTVAGGTYNGNTSSGTISGAFVLSSGAYNGNTSTPTFSGGLTISGGTFTASSGTTTVSGGWTHTAGGTFTHSSGTVAFTGNSTTADVTTTETFSGLTINKTDGQTLTIASGDTLIATGTLTLTDGTWGTGSVQAQGNVSVPLTWDAGGSGTLEFAGTGTQTFDLTGATAAFDNPVNINKGGGSLTLASAYTLDHANADFTVTLGTFSTGNYAMTTSSGSDIVVNGGIFNAGSSTMTIAGLLTVSSGTYNANTSTPTYSNTVTVSGGTYNGNTSTPSFNGAFLISSGAYNGSANGDTFAGGFTISGGTFTASDATTTVSSTWTHTAGGTFTHNSGTVAMTGAASTIDVATSETFSSLTINKNNAATLTITSGDSLISVGTLTLTNGAVGTGTLQPQGAVSVGAGFDGGNAPMTFAGSAAQTFTLTGATDKFDGDIPVNKSSETVSLGSALVMDASGQDLTVTLGTFSTTGTNYAVTVAGNVAVNGGTLTLNGSTVDINGDLTIGGGTLNMGSATITIAGGVTYTSGTMTPGTSSVTLDGTSQTLAGATTWNNLTKIVTTATTLTLPAGATTTISGTMNFQGAVGQLLSLRSSSTGTQTTLSPALVTTPYYLDVKDNVITKSTSCITSTQGCVNSSNNSGWTFTTSSDDDVSNSNSPENIWIRVTAPNGGETYVVGSTVRITWDSSGAIHRVNIAFSPDAGDTWTALASSVMNVNAYTWTIDGSHTTDGMIRVEAFDGLTAYRTDTSDDVFAITGESDSTETEEVTDVPIVSTDPIVQARVEALPTSVAVHGLVKLADDGNPETQADSAVYYIGADGYRHAFPNQAVFLSWFADFSQVQIISASDLSSMAFGPNITYRPGVRMVKFLSSAKTYAVDAFGELRWIETEAIAVALYGEHWTTLIDDISDAFFGNYTIGRSINHPSAFDPEAETARTVYPSDSIVIPGYND